MNKGRYHWSNLAREVLFFAVHWAAAVPWIVLIFYQTWTIFSAAILSVLVLFYVRFISKMTLPAAWRSVWYLISGREKATNNWFKEFIRQR
ncbi:hypothetical protein [Bordetella flabilis]|uniref:hypothetical protein n=1 Tax=Bordetella flabilis TaxID=463014 RepID=UPI0012F47862|nr:hypothetical protein [Bordetella flabilis]